MWHGQAENIVDTNAVAGDPAMAIVEAETRQQLANAIQRLTTQQQQAIKLVYLEGLNLSQAADKIGKKVTTIKTHLMQGKKRLLQILAADAIQRLLPQEARALKLIYFQGVTHKKAAAEMNIPVTEIKAFVRQAKAKLFKELLIE